MNLFRFIPGYETSVYEAGREPIFVALVALFICFVLTRGYTRAARTHERALAAYEQDGNAEALGVVDGLVAELAGGRR